METLPTPQGSEPAFTPAFVPELKEPQALPLARETALRALLDPEQSVYHNFEVARDSGLIDAFHYNPETGYDAIVHILQGEVHDIEGAREVAGYHLESASHSPDTYVSTDLASKSRKRRREFNRFPFEPYKANVVINGYVKKVAHKDEATGQYRLDNAESSMFPEEYDPLAVLQGIKIARDTRDVVNDKPGHDDTIITIGEVPMLDGKTMLPIKLILDRESQAIVTAIPMTKSSGRMRLTPPEIQQHLGLSN